MTLPTARLCRALPLFALALAGLLATAPADAQSWTQLGADLDGEAASDQAGHSVSLSGDRLAIGAPSNDGTDANAGHVRVYEWNATTEAWDQLGADLDGEAAGDQAGFSVSLSGNRVAVGARYNDGGGSDAGHARVYEWDATTEAWAQLGADLDGEAAGDNSGHSVSLSGDRLAVGAPRNRGAGNYSGHVRVYEWNATTEAWDQLGADLEGEAVADFSGWSVSLSGDRLAIGAIGNDAGGSSSGHARVYEWNSGTSTWARLGADLDGEAAGDESGISVSLSGDRVVVGSARNGGGGSEAGHARVYEWDATTEAWAQLGADLDGEAAGDRSGHSVSLSGERLAIGAFNNDGVGISAGHARVYEWNATAEAWDQFGADLDGEAAGDNSGYSVSLSDDRLAIGAVNNDGAGRSAGHVRVYSSAPVPVASVTLDGAEGWRTLASPEATTVGAFLDALWTQGFPGADDPAGACSVFRFNEAAPTFSAGWTCVSGGEDPLAPGQGLMVYVYEDDDFDGTVTPEETFPKTLASSTAVEPAASFDFALAYSDGGRASGQRGWNLLGAPFGTSMVWAEADRSGIGTTVYVYDPAYFGGGYRTYTLDGASGYGDLTGGIVPPFQGFFAQAVAAAPALGLTLEAVASGQDVYGRGAGPGDPPGPPPAPAQSTSVATAADDGAPPTAALGAIVPNPTTGAATVAWTQAEAGPARLTVVDLLGREVAVLADGPFAPGAHRATLGAGLAPGVYVVRLETGTTVAAARVVVAR